MPNLENQTILLAILVVTALAVLLQAFILMGILFAVRRLSSSLKQEIEDLRSSVMPICDRVGDFLDHSGPKLEAAIEDAAALTHNLRQVTVLAEITTQDILQRVYRQSTRVDAMLSNVLDGLDRASVVVAQAVVKPARQISGLLAFADAAIDSLRSSRATPRHPSSRHDEDGLA